MNRRTRSGYGKLVVLVIVTVAVAYYGYMGVKCYKHCQALMNDKMTTINFAIND
jgi:hypothetical protein